MKNQLNLFKESLDEWKEEVKMSKTRENRLLPHCLVKSRKYIIS